MAVFVLVHGGWEGSWVWKRVRPLLQARGHQVFTPTLTGLGGRSHLLSRDVHLRTHVDDVVNLLRWEELEGVVLCGHSYSGMVVTGVAEAAAERVRTLVYLDAVVGEPGRSFFDSAPPEVAAAQREQAASAGEGWYLPPAPAKGLVNDADVDWVNRQCTPQPLATLEEPLRLTDRATSIRDTRFIMTTGWPKDADGREQTPLAPAIALAGRRGWPVTRLATHHHAMLDDPAGLVAELVR